LCGFVAALLRGRRLTAGLCLAGAICLKIIPAFLLVLPLWRRDGRCLAGCAVGVLVGLVLVPVAALGPARAVACYHDQYRFLIAPALGAGEDRLLARELTDITSTDSQSFQVVLHNNLHRDRATRPRLADPWVRRVHWLLGAAMLLVTLWAFHRPARPGTPDEARRLTLFAGALTLNMILVSPVCHLHYFALAVPAVMALLAPTLWRAYPGWPLWLLLAFNFAATLLPSLPGMFAVRDGGLATASGLLLWGVACVALRRRPETPAEVGTGRPALAA
jgi:hypothetical protein